MAASRYGWTHDYILWGISFANLMGMLNDKADVLYGYYKEDKNADGYPEIDTNSSDYLQVDEDTSIGDISRIVGTKR